MRNLNQTTSTNFQILPPDFETQHSGKLRPTFSLEEDRLIALRQILPEAFADGKINFETLRELLGDVVENERDEHFGLSWAGKKEARRLAGTLGKGSLVPVPGEGVDEATTENIFIEGDNLEVLKLLHKSYRGRVKMIYIDPPYNTGNDFIYKDNYREPLESYLQRSGQMTDAGELLSSNSKGDGRFHSNWLNMMYPRLRVASDLLTEDGVIFVSIDDNEFHNLRQILNEIFGEENFVGVVTWVKKTKPINSGDAKFQLQSKIEYVVCFAKSKSASQTYKFKLKEVGKRTYEFDGKLGKCRLKDIEDSDYGGKQRDTMKFPILGIRPPEGKRWKIGADEAKRLADSNRIETVGGKVKIAVYPEDEEGIIFKPFWSNLEVSESGTAETGKATLNELLEKNVGFDTVKPIGLIKELIFHSVENGIVLDFFVGSRTTPQAVYELNCEDNFQRKFICVQIPEETKADSSAYKAGYRTIADLSKSRIRLASNQIKNEQNGISPLLQQAKTSGEKQDLGFKVFRLERSNFRAWTDFTGQEFSDFLPLLESAETPFVAEATHDGILNEILLLEGFPLNSNVTLDSRFERNKVYLVASEFSEHRLFIALDEEVWEETIDNAGELDKNDIFICLDNSLNDESKVRLADVCRLKTI